MFLSSLPCQVVKMVVASAVNVEGDQVSRRKWTWWLRKSPAPEVRIWFWLGRANKSVTDAYSKRTENLHFRKECTEKVGLGILAKHTPSLFEGDLPMAMAALMVSPCNT